MRSKAVKKPVPSDKALLQNSCSLIYPLNAIKDSSIIRISHYILVPLNTCQNPGIKQENVHFKMLSIGRTFAHVKEKDKLM